MADATGEFDFGTAFQGIIDWANNNPQAVGALLGGIGTLADPAQGATTTQAQQVQLPDYIAPLVGRALNRAESLSQEEYIPYGGQRVADFNQDQLQAFQQYRDMQAMSPYQTQGAGIVGEAANQLMQAGGQRFDQAAADQYMSPYMQSVLDVQKRKVLEDYNQQLPALDARAQKAGAFGGSRHGLVEAQAQKNMNQQLQDIQAQGMQSAFTNAQGQFNADMNRLPGMYGTAGNMGNTLSGIGQQGFQNQLAVNQGLMGIGNQQQQLNQQGLNVGYENFLAQRQHPYTQQDFLRASYSGLPMTQTSSSTFTPAPSMTNQLIGNMAAGYGLGGYYNQPATAPKP